MTKTLNTEWPPKLKAWRGEARTQEWAAKRLGVSLSCYTRWETGKNTPRGLSLVALERELSKAGKPTLEKTT